METFIELLQQVGTANDMSNTPYDTAWIARLQDIEPGISERALDWICEHQLDDGSWGARFPMYYHDRLICTLSALISLAYRGRRQKVNARIEKGLNALGSILSGAARGLEADSNGATVGFEVIVPILVAEAEQLGLIKQHKESILGKLAHVRQIKMEKLAGIKISRYVTIAHSAEMTGKDRLDMLDVENLQEANGSVANSPSATSHFALHVRPGDERALNYLTAIINSQNGGAPSLTPIDIFERIWVLWNLSITNLYRENKQIAALCDSHLDYLESHWKHGQGLGFSSTFTLTDGDDTSVGFDILSKFGRKPELEAVLQYEEEKWFRCYFLETKPSTDVNIHVLGALRQAGYDKKHPSVQKAINFIRSKRQPRKRYWFDKWHISPYYTTSHMIILCNGYDDELCQESVDWILKTQKKDGSWGFYQASTAEETAYCIQALIIWQRYTGKIYRDKIKKARNWLARNSHPPYPPLWIGKSLFYPEILVKSSIVSALTLAEE